MKLGKGWRLVKRGSNAFDFGIGSNAMMIEIALGSMHQVFFRMYCSGILILHYHWNL